MSLAFASAWVIEVIVIVFGILVSVKVEPI